MWATCSNYSNVYHMFFLGAENGIYGVVCLSEYFIPLEVFRFYHHIMCQPDHGIRESTASAQIASIGERESVAQIEVLVMCRHCAGYGGI